MSWHRQYSSKTDFEDDKPSSTSESIDPIVLSVAREVASDVINSGVVGSRDKDYSVYLSGHINPNHEPKEGWANDTVTVTVTQK